VQVIQALAASYSEAMLAMHGIHTACPRLSLHCPVLSVQQQVQELVGMYYDSQGILFAAFDTDSIP